MRAPSWLFAMATVGGAHEGVAQALQSRFFMPVPPLIQALADTPSAGGNATFSQLIDHSNPGLGTFSQQYWWNTTHWDGPGSPVCYYETRQVTSHCNLDSC